MKVTSKEKITKYLIKDNDLQETKTTRYKNGKSKTRIS